MDLIGLHDGIKKNKNEIILQKVNEQHLNINKILEKLINYLCLHIENQINAGADLVQIFDSWAGLIPEPEIRKLCYEPNLKIVNFCKQKKIPVICFPKGIKERYLDFNKIVKPNGLSLDYDVDPTWAKEKLTDVALQGGMRPQILLKSDEEIFKEAKKYLNIFKDVPYVFNLGHGIVPETDPDKLEKLIKFVRKNK